MAYRSDVDALQARHDALQAELAERQRERDDVAAMLADARALDESERVLADLANGGPARRRRKRLLIAAAIGALVLVGSAIGYRVVECRRPDRIEETMAQMSMFADQFCSCSTTECTQAVSNSMATWAQSLSKEFATAPKLDDATMKRVTEIGERMGKCITRAMGGGQQF